MKCKPGSESIVVMVAVPIGLDPRLIAELAGSVPKVKSISSSGVRYDLSIKTIPVYCIKVTKKAKTSDNLYFYNCEVSVSILKGLQ